ncbi:hypothetical protein D3C76_1857180 [compost metagenome]
MMYLAGVFFAVMSGLFLLSQLVLLFIGKLADDDFTVSVSEDEDEAERLMAQGALK